MALNYVIDKDRRLVISTASDVLTGTDAVEHQKRLSEDPDFDPAYSQLLDLTGVTSMSMDVQIIRQLVARNIFHPEARRAAAVSSGLATGLMRMMKSYADASGNFHQTQIFRDREEALAWLFAT